MLCLLIPELWMSGSTLPTLVISTVSHIPTLFSQLYDAILIAPQLAGESVWGRGSSDDKSGLIGVMYVVS